ncbi:MAG: pilus assembly protein [Alphaproteobacteria bacterium]|nr:pilus assembly protein [Alphaproteobacteria bacterium]MBU2042283.1 pilus assembly protein [Alphaproteobacteria bacterium]MBU2126959.1 pilus assembly protein [Alphaproteobacteria bacterium]MBU2207612.1 pilus assembly protein [Alphaproteobacteria bacterium]MBU2291131.1 pilus assembly protein [Alphaproteobacteria bacterium]
MGRALETPILHGLRTFLRRLLSDARGNVAMLFGLSLPVLILMTVGGVDIHRASTVRVNLQDALDAAALAAARSPYTEADDIREVGLTALRANLQAYPDIILREADTSFILNSDNVVIANSKVDVKTLVANIFLPPYGKFMDDYLPVGAHSEVDRSSKNIEVGLVLDITGSMSGQRIVDLKAAANQLVDIVVQDVQTPFYTRMAIVPYSVGVNVGSYANSARGTPIGARSISHMAWAMGTAKSISGITRANKGVVTTTVGHGLQNNDYVWIRDVEGMEAVNDRAYRVKRINSKKFSLESWNGSSWVTVNTSGYGSYDDEGEVRQCLLSDCAVQVTAPGHGLEDGEGVYITGANGMTEINNRPYIVANVTNNTYSIGVNGAEWGAHTSGGSSWCGRDGCQWRVFYNPSGTLRALETSTCVSERAGPAAYTDAGPSASTWVGRNYPSTSGNRCPAATILPLNSNKSTLKSLINSLSVTGSTAGHIGMAWGWYSVSPNFNTLWPSSPAGAYAPEDTLKVVIIMTDGEFNTPYSTGVIAQNAGSGSGGSEDKINQNATNGDPFTQGEALCDAMKAAGVIVYTVGFQISAGGNAAALLADCASSPQHAHLPSSGSDLSEAFAAIGRDITRLRISK